MNKIIIVILVISVWGFYIKSTKTHNELLPVAYEEKKSEKVDVYVEQYECDGREHCSQMGSYEEAKFFLDNCPNTKMDGDYDGIPCERQFAH